MRKSAYALIAIARGARAGGAGRALCLGCGQPMPGRSSWLSGVLLRGAGQVPDERPLAPSLLQAPLRAVGYPSPSPRAARASAAFLHPPLRPRARSPAAHMPARRPARAPDPWRRESRRPCPPICFRRFRENAALWQPVLRGGLSWMADERNMRGRQMGNAALIWGNTCC